MHKSVQFNHSFNSETKSFIFKLKYDVTNESSIHNIYNQYFNYSMDCFNASDNFNKDE